MIKISGQIIKLNTEAMKNWKVDKTAEGKTFAQTKIQRGIFQEDTLSPLLIVIAMMPLHHILRKCRVWYIFSDSQENINPLMYISRSQPPNVHLPFAKTKRKTIGAFNANKKNIQSGYRDKIWHRKIGYATYEKRKKKNNN